MSQQQTTAEKFEEWRKLVSWVLWKVATTDPESDEPWRGYSLGESACIQGHAESLFNDSNWIGNVVGRFAANSVIGDGLLDTIDWAEFEKAVEEKPSWKP